MTEREGNKKRREKEVLVRTELFDKALLEEGENEQAESTGYSEENCEGFRIPRCSPASKLEKNKKN